MLVSKYSTVVEMIYWNLDLLLISSQKSDWKTKKTYLVSADTVTEADWVDN